MTPLSPAARARRAPAATSSAATDTRRTSWFLRIVIRHLFSPPAPARRPGQDPRAHPPGGPPAGPGGSLRRFRLRLRRTSTGQGAVPRGMDCSVPGGTWWECAPGLGAGGGHAREAGQGGIAVLAVVVKEPGQVVLEERPRPVRPPGCALIRVTLAGVCQTDLELVRGYMGFTGILGHEFVGVVEEADDARWVGRRV